MLLAIIAIYIRVEMIVSLNKNKVVTSCNNYLNTLM